MKELALLVAVVITGILVVLHNATLAFQPTGGAPALPTPPPLLITIPFPTPVPVALPTPITTVAGVPDASGYIFPVVGWHGVVQLHWGSVPGGSDLFAARGTPVVAMHAARVITAGWDSIGGNAVFAQGTDGLQYYYAHFNATPAVQAGQIIAAGTYLGPVGNTGDASGGATHLHIGIGPTILLGADKFGGTGGTFNAVGLLQRTLDSTHGQ